MSVTAARSKLYPSKRDTWLVLAAWGTVVLAVAGAAPAIQLASRAELTVMMTLVMAVNALVLWVLYGTAYWFDNEMLRIRCGPLRVSVSVARIDSVEPIRNWQSSPACSIDRLVLRYGERAIMISPREREEFIDDLQRRNPGVILKEQK